MGAFSLIVVINLLNRLVNRVSGMTLKSRWKTKNRKRDYDQLAEDAKPENALKLLNQEHDLELAGDAQFYCVSCARYFIDNNSLNSHHRSKTHKRKVAKIVDYNAYDHKEAMAAAGFGSYTTPLKKFKKEDIDVRKETLAMTD